MLEDKNSNKEILERLDQYRSIEISNLWQRSVFLGTFLVLGYTGYGFLLDKMLSFTAVCFCCPNNEVCKIEHKSYLALYHFIAGVLACINIIFSVLWIAMAKGSKAWYEVYENAIQGVELEVNKGYHEVRKSIHLKFAQKNDCLFSTKAGGYSPSKINIAIGQISFVFWCVILVVHVVIICKGSFILIDEKYFKFILIIVGTIILVGVLSYRKSWIKSSYFKD